LILAGSKLVNTTFVTEAHKETVTEQELLERISYMAFADERSKLQEQLGRVYQQSIAENPADAYRYLRLVHLYFNSESGAGINIKDVTFAMQYVRKVAFYDPKVRRYFAQVCFSGSSKLSAIESGTCHAPHKYLPTGVKLKDFAGSFIDGERAFYARVDHLSNL
ncbi:MAG: hypothetical protein AAF197_12955, partial [Pseudomonadota bacterium]